MGEYRLNTCLYTNTSFYIDEFTSYIKQFNDALPYDDKNELFRNEHYILMINYWINIIDSPYLHIVKSDRFIFHSLSYEFHNIIKYHPLTLNLKEQFPSNNLCFFFYSYAISHEIQKSLLKYLPKQLVENYYLSLNKPSFFDQTDEDFNKEYNREIVKIKRLIFYELNTNIAIQQEISSALHKCTLFAKECVHNSMNSLHRKNR